MAYEVSANDREFLNALGLQAYTIPNQPGTFVRPAPEKVRNDRGEIVPNPNYRPLSKSVAYDFEFGGGTNSPDGTMTSLDNTKSNRPALESIPIVLYFSGPTAKLPYSMAAQYRANKGFKTWEEATDVQREIQKTDPDILAQRENLRKAKVAKAEKSGFAVMRPDDAVAPLVEAIQALTAQSASQQSRGPGRPPKAQGTDD